MLYIYRLERDTSHWDEITAAVVVASSPNEARELVAKMAHDEGPAAWLLPAVVSCEIVGQALEEAESGIILLQTVDG